MHQHSGEPCDITRYRRHTDSQCVISATKSNASRNLLATLRERARIRRLTMLGLMSTLLATIGAAELSIILIQPWCSVRIDRIGVAAVVAGVTLAVIERCYESDVGHE